MRARWWLAVLVLTAALAAPSGAGQTAPGSGIIFVADVEGVVGANVSFDADYPYPHFKTRAGDASLGVSYGVVNWDAGVCTAGQQARLAKYANPDDDYERLGTWGGGGWWKEITRGARGLLRYDQDTYLVLNGQYIPTNANGARAPTLLQIEYYDGWFTSAPYTDDQYLDALNYDSIYLLRAACRPGSGLQWGPRPRPPLLTPVDPNDPNNRGEPCDWTWTGAGTTGKLQFADTYTIGTAYRWNNDPNNPLYDYITFNNKGINYQVVDNAWGPFRVGSLYKGSGYFAGTSVLELAAFYGETENVLYVTQYEGRIYKLVGVKNLGWRRRAGQPAPGAKLGDGTNITQPPDYFFPVIVGPTYLTDTSGGGPVIGDAVVADPNDPNSPYVGTAMTSVELFNADPNSPLDPVVTDRHYTGLAVDAGGRVYAVSEQIVDPNGQPPVLKYQGSSADVWNGAPGTYGPNRIETQNTVGTGTPPDPNDPNDPGDPVRGALFGDPWTTNVVPGDQLVLTSTISGTSLAPQFLGVPFTIEAIDPNGYYARLDGDCGDSGANFDVNYTVFPPGVSPIPDPNTNPFYSQALIDVYQPDGTLDATIDLNSLTRPDGVALSQYQYDGGNIHGVIIHGDVEIDPGLLYDPNDPNWPLAPLGNDVTRLWIYCASGDGDPNTNDGLDLALVDVNIDVDGTVAGASFVGGTDDGDIDVGMFHQGDYTQGFIPWNMWIAFSELEFDGQSNLVAVGGRGINDNRYTGVTAEHIREFVGRLRDEADPNNPNFGDGIVGINGFNMDMNLYGFQTACGISFDNSPLSNYGAGPLSAANLVATEPNADSSLPKTQNNLILCTFDGVVPDLPTVGNPLVILDMTNGCADVSSSFVYSIDTDDLTGQTLQAQENGDLLPNMTWYQVSNDPAWAGVNDFQFEVYTLVGDCDASGRVTTLDYTCVKGSLGARGDLRPDLDGSARVTTLDYSVVKGSLGARAPIKPALCP